MRLKDQVVIITGGAQGIGKVYGQRCAAEGAKVVLADIRDAEPVAAELRQGGAEALALHTDVADETSTAEMARRTVERFGRIDVLVNNAAVFAITNPRDFWEIPTSDWDLAMAVNVKGPFLCTKAVLPRMRAQGKGKIINIASGTAFKGTVGVLHYVSSKGAVISLTRTMARELGPFNIAVNAIAPGFVLHEGMRASTAQVASMSEPVKKSRCFQRDQTPEDLTGTLVYLASADSDFVTGQVIAVDGGSVMH
ncbi:MAG: 3-oxoacyl-ACP reductase FabG [Candidatus Tectomicrobia bacterium]|nr:3-oxoacyl-ACP reductase FabG [Candidatus Tectomicrobia bacterium]